jgi:hypothetical protein
MKDFLLIFRADYEKMTKRTEEESKAMTKKWMDWVGGIAAQNKLIDRGNRLFNTGKVLKNGNVITNGPYSDIKESIGGYTMIKADSYDDATELAKSCPIFFVDGNVEIREVSPM